MPPIAFPSSTAPGDRAQEGGGRLINAFAEQLGEGARSAVKIVRAPGLTEFAGTEGGTPRGITAVGVSLYAAFDGELIRVAQNGDAVSLGTIVGDEPVYFAYNNRTPVPDAVVVTDSAVYTFDTDDVDELNEPDLPNPNGVCFLDGYFFFTIGDGRCFASGLNDTTVNANDFIRAESSPGGLIRPVPFEGRLFLCGPNAIEVWTNTAEPTGFPFSRATIIQKGLISPRAIAGFEHGFSSELIWVGDDNAVHVLRGYEPQKISTPSLDTLIEGVDDKSDLHASVFTSEGHAFWVLSGPDFTWVYDVTTGTWHERRSYLDTRWRGVYSVSAFGKWFVQDRQSGAILEIDSEKRREIDDPLVWEVESIEMHGFPRRIAVHRADFDFVVGQGEATGEDPIQTSPRVLIAWSDDGGYRWSVPVERRLGRQAETKTRVTINRTGMTGPQGRRWKLTVSDPVYVSLLGGDMRVQGETI